jgi:hypothetical protein
LLENSICTPHLLGESLQRYANDHNTIGCSLLDGDVHKFAKVFIGLATYKP